MDGDERAFSNMDSTTTAILRAANIGTDMLPSLSKEDLRDLFPGPEHFFRRRAIWKITHVEIEGEESDHVKTSTSSENCDDIAALTTSNTFSSPSSSSNLPPPSNPGDQHGTSRSVQLVSPQYVVYTDTELEQARTTYFEKQRAGQEGAYTLSKELRCRLIRNTVTSMIAIKRAAGDDFQYPCSREITVMAKRLIEYFPMLQDKTSVSGGAEWESVKKQLLKRVQNVTPTKKKQGATPSRKKRRDMSLDSRSSHETSADDTECGVSSLIFERSPPESRGSSEAELMDVEPESHDSLQNQARHYKVLQELYKSKPRPNKKDAAQLLDLEFQARRAYIDSDLIKEQDRPTKILQAYPCFRELDHLMDEMHRILNQGKSHLAPELKNRWGTFFEKAQFYGVFKKIMRPPMGNKVQQTITMMNALPDMFPSQVAPPKKLGHVSEVMLHLLGSGEDPNTFLQSRPLFSPVVIVCETNCVLAIGTTPVLIFPKEDISDCVMYIMACYYTFHLTYPKCIATLLSVLQTEVLLDTIHDRDMTSSYKKAMAEWKKFIAE